uniref:C-C motif chemokine n=1 Tax=Pelusios castaneus TaxID=367368 RepID=A0A8C8SB04_9SAUR
MFHPALAAGRSYAPPLLITKLIVLCNINAIKIINLFMEHICILTDIPTSCCFSYTARQIPQSMVRGYYETSSKCSLPAIVFITKKGRNVCADPTDFWVGGYMKNLGLN